MKQYLMLFAFVVFSVSQVTFANINPELEGKWKISNLACVDSDKNEAVSDPIPLYIPEEDEFYLDFNSTDTDGTTGDLNIESVNTFATYSFDNVSGEEVEEWNAVSCTVNGTYSTSENSISVNVDMLSMSGECVEGDDGFNSFKESGMTLSTSIGNINYFVESDRLYLEVPVNPLLFGGSSDTGGTYTSDTVVYDSVNDTTYVVDTQSEWDLAEESVDDFEAYVDLECGDTEKPAVVFEKI